MNRCYHPITASMPKQKVYAVRQGRKNGIYYSWSECEAQVKGFSGAQFKSFDSLREAETYLGVAGSTDGKSTTLAAAAAAARGRYQPYTTEPPQATVPLGVRAQNHLSQVPTPAPPSQLPHGSSSHHETSTPQAGRPDAQMVLARCMECASQVEQEEGLDVKAVPGMYTVHFDGASRNNPGLSGSGACISETATGQMIIGLACPLPYGCTNNEAEYCGLILGLQACALLGIRAPLVKGDSKLVVMQVQGKWKVNATNLVPYYDAACALLDSLRAGQVLVDVQHVYREDNKEADRLSNVAMDMQINKGG